jgi:protein SCO1/2
MTRKNLRPWKLALGLIAMALATSVWVRQKASGSVPTNHTKCSTSPLITRGPAAEGKRVSGTLKRYFPNVVLTTQENKRVLFYDDLIKGKVVLINFMFTTCTYVCPRTTINLKAVQECLGERLGRDVFIISISVDPTTDTPELLAKYAETHRIKPGWYFLTGTKKNVDTVRSALGAYDEDKMQHTGVLIFGNEATGVWLKAVAMAKPAEIAAAVMRLLNNR